jgi:hypothetical protein
LFLKALDGWSSMVMIPVSHTGGREFKSLPIHFYFVAPDFRCYPALFMILKVTTLFSFIITGWFGITSGSTL